MDSTHPGTSMVGMMSNLSSLIRFVAGWKGFSSLDRTTIRDRSDFLIRKVFFVRNRVVFYLNLDNEDKNCNNKTKLNNNKTQ